MDLKHLIRDQIRQYRLVSRSKLLRHLKLRNVDAIASQIDVKQFNILMEKKQYYNQKLLKLMNSVQIKTIDDSDELDSTVITSRFLAKKYIRQLLENETFRTFITKTVEKHQQFQTKCEQKRRQLPPQEQTKYDMEVVKQCKNLESECIEGLVRYGVPFYVLQDPYQYPELHSDKEWILQEIKTTVAGYQI